MAPARCPAPVAGIAVAYSGGPDSTALLYALAQAGYRCPLRALHVCHNMQPEAQQWVNHCREQCAQLNISFACLQVRVDTRAEGAEAAARRARYDALAAALQPGEALVLAHHADDQAETFLIQALRGAGVAGLAAMPTWAAFASGYSWRPLLHLSRETLRAYVAAQQLPVVDDPSNQDTHLDRGHLRQQVWPALLAHWPQASATLSRSAHWCAQAADLVAEIAASDALALVDAQGRMSVAQLRDLSTFRQAGVLRHWLAVVGFDAPDHRHVREIQRLLVVREHAGPQVRWRDTEVRLFDGHLHALRPLPVPPENWSRSWQLTTTLDLPPGCGSLVAEYDGVAQQQLRVTLRRGGERFTDSRRGGSRTLKKFLQEARVPPWWRSRLPLVYADGELVAIADYWLQPALAARLGVTNLRFIWRRDTPE